MPDKKISALTAVSTPLVGTEEIAVVQSGSTKKVSVASLTAGRATDVKSLAVDTTLRAWNAGYTVIDIGARAAVFSDSGVTNTTSTNQYINSGFTRVYAQDGYATQYQQNSNDGTHTWSVAPSGTAGTGIAFVDALKIENNANVKAVTGDFVAGVAGKGVVLTNTAGTVIKRVRLNDAGDGLVFESV